jgi:hypothetical protein
VGNSGGTYLFAFDSKFGSRLAFGLTGRSQARPCSCHADLKVNESAVIRGLGVFLVGAAASSRQCLLVRFLGGALPWFAPDYTPERSLCSDLQHTRGLVLFRGVLKTSFVL